MFRKLLLPLIAVILLSSCKDNTPNVPFDSVFKPRIKFDFTRPNGSKFEAVETGGLYNGEQLVIYGYNFAGDKIEFSLYKPEENDSFTLTRTNSFSSGSYKRANGTTITSISHNETNVQIEILNLDLGLREINAVFSGVMYSAQKQDTVRFNAGVVERLFFDYEPLPPADLPFMQVTVNNAALPINQLTAFIAANEIVVSGRNAQTNRQVLFYMDKNITAGTYFFLGHEARPMGQFNIGNNLNYFSKTGTLNVLENNTTTGRLEFTFSFQGENLNNPSDVVNLSNGSCMVFYPPPSD
jgi:hypothetical protein